jgi:hypothetical protein
MHLSVIVPTLSRIDTAPLIAGRADLLVAPVREFLYLHCDRCPVLLRGYFAAGDVMRCGRRLEL